MRLPRKTIFLFSGYSFFAETLAYLPIKGSWQRTARRQLRPKTLHAARDPSDGSTDFPNNPVLSRSSFLVGSALAIIGASLTLSAPEGQAVVQTTEGKYNRNHNAGKVLARKTLTTSVDATSKHGTHKQRKDVLQSINDTLVPMLAASDESNSMQESISGFVAGGALAAAKTLVKYPLDTVTVRLQVPNADYSISNFSQLFSGSYNGVTLSLLSNIPGGAVFFAVKDAVKASLKHSLAFSAAPKWVTTTMAVGAALLPYWVVRNPSEVIKVRQQAGIPGYGEGVSAWDAIQLTFNKTAARDGGLATRLSGIKEFYTGYWENVIYGLPADVIKFVAYEAFTGGRRDLSPLEGAQAGAFATATAQLVTTPLDVVRNRLMAGTESTRRRISNPDETTKEENYIQALIALGKEEGIRGLFAGTTPRVAKAFLSGAIQFATYEETKQSISRFIQPKIW